jgi:RNA polymerase sigma factor (sigma-70 family)
VDSEDQNRKPPDHLDDLAKSCVCWAVAVNCQLSTVNWFGSASVVHSAFLSCGHCTVADRPSLSCRDRFAGRRSEKDEASGSLMDDMNTADLNYLVERIQAGDSSAKNQLFTKVIARLESLTRKMLKNYPVVMRFADTMDVLQEASIRLLRALETVTPASTRDFSNLSAVQIRRQLLDLARHFGGRCGHGANLSDQQLDDDVAVAPASSDSQDLERWSRFHESVESLPSEEREVLSLKFYHGWTERQIGELLNVNERTVRRWYKSASDRLRKMVDG